MLTFRGVHFSGLQKALKNFTEKTETNYLALRSFEEIKVSGGGGGGEGVQHFLLHIFPLEMRRQTPQMQL